jgi:hypothetical protein
MVEYSTGSCFFIVVLRERTLPGHSRPAGFFLGYGREGSFHVNGVVADPNVAKIARAISALATEHPHLEI